MLNSDHEELSPTVNQRKGTVQKRSGPQSGWCQLVQWSLHPAESFSPYDSSDWLHEKRPYLFFEELWAHPTTRLSTFVFKMRFLRCGKKPQTTPHAIFMKLQVCILMLLILHIMLKWNYILSTKDELFTGLITLSNIKVFFKQLCSSHGFS